MKASINYKRKVEGVTPQTKVAGISLDTRIQRSLEKAGYTLVEDNAEIEVDWATVYTFHAPLEVVFRIEGAHQLALLTNLLWNSCRKDVDGIISKNHNRHLSLFISRRIARFGISPNYISLVTFSLGILSGVFASMGTYSWVFLGGLFFQMASVIDGVDGELARVKLEFSVLGEWLDTISDDSSDLAFYGGLGIGAYRLNYELGFLSPTVFLVLAVIAVLGKLLSMFFYYRVLIAKKRGDLYAFDWGERSAQESKGLMAKVEEKLRYITKNDFISFAAFVLAAVGLAPLLLVAVAPGVLIVSYTVAQQTRKNNRRMEETVVPLK